MSKVHLWAGQLESGKLLDSYLDQRAYLKAWAKYDHHSPTGNPAEDAEPSPALRCQFCKDTGIDTYDEDQLVYKYYSRPADAEILARDIPGDIKEIKKLFKSKKLSACNAFIAYQDSNINANALPDSALLNYLGQINGNNADHDSGAGLRHYLWIGSNKLSKVQIVKATRLNDSEIKNIHFYYDKVPKRIDEIIILEVPDVELAEQMILKADASAASTETNAMLLLSLDKNKTSN